MFRTVQIDPETLAVNINADVLSDHSRGPEFFEFVDASRRDGLLLPLLAATKKNDIELVSFGASLLHEYRHFGDLLLSPFGFYRVRTAFEFFYNLPYLLFTSSDEVAVPLMSGMDPITRAAIGIGPEFENSFQYRLGLSPFTRVRLINQENEFDRATSRIKIGGDRILEGLAYITQFEFLFHNFSVADGRKHFNGFFQDYEGSEFDRAYRWFIPDVHDFHPGEVMPNNTLMSSVLFASLCGSITVKASATSGPRPSKVPSRDVSAQLPSNRYGRLASYFRERPRPSISEPREAFELVDDVCSTLFGRRIIDEISEDIEFSRQFVRQFRQQRPKRTGIGGLFNPVPLFEELVDYRETLLRIFSRFPESFCTAQGFYQMVAPGLRPSLIYHLPRGIRKSQSVNFSKEAKRWVGLVDRTFDPPKSSVCFPEVEPFVYAVWCPLTGDNGSRLSVESGDDEDATLKIPALASRQGVYGILGPLYRWILYGNKYRSMSEVENEDFFTALRLDRARFKLDPLYEDAEDISLPDLFFRFYGGRLHVCDVCGTAVEKDSSFLVSSRTMRQNPKVVEYWRTFEPDLEFQFRAKDWSDWLICVNDMHRFGFEIPQREH